MPEHQLEHQIRTKPCEHSVTASKSSSGMAKEIYTPYERPNSFRPTGSPAGSYHHTPWWVCVIHDPYERINFWSHFLPGVAFVALGVSAFLGFIPGGIAMAIFTMCAATTHLLSALTHVWPDDHSLEKCDHVGIIALIVGTPFTAVMATGPGNDLGAMALVTLALFAAAFMPPLPRTMAFCSLSAVMFFIYFYIVNANLCAQVALYLIGAGSFVRNSGHGRWEGWTDHHLLHYTVTAACVLHIQYIFMQHSSMN